MISPIFEWIDIFFQLLIKIIGGVCMLVTILIGIGLVALWVVGIRMKRERARLLPDLLCPFCKTRYGNAAAEKALIVYQYECRQFELYKEEYSKEHPRKMVSWADTLLTIRCPECWRVGKYDERTRTVIDSGFVENPPVKPDLSKENMKI